jgi:hypothetical protein
MTGAGDPLFNDLATKNSGNQPSFRFADRLTQRGVTQIRVSREAHKRLVLENPHCRAVALELQV